MNQKRVASLRQKASADVFAENAAVLVLFIKMLTNPARQIILSRVRADAYNALSAVSVFAVLE